MSLNASQASVKVDKGLFLYDTFTFRFTDKQGNTIEKKINKWFFEGPWGGLSNRANLIVGGEKFDLSQSEFVDVLALAIEDEPLKKHDEVNSIFSRINNENGSSFETYVQSAEQQKKALDEQKAKNAKVQKDAAAAQREAAERQRQKDERQADRIRVEGGMFGPSSDKDKSKLKTGFDSSAGDTSGSGAQKSSPDLGAGLSLSASKERQPKEGSDGRASNATAAQGSTKKGSSGPLTVYRHAGRLHIAALKDTNKGSLIGEGSGILLSDRDSKDGRKILLSDGREEFIDPVSLSRFFANLAHVKRLGNASEGRERIRIALDDLAAQQATPSSNLARDTEMIRGFLEKEVFASTKSPKTLEEIYDIVKKGGVDLPDRDLIFSRNSPA